MNTDSVIEPLLTIITAIIGVAIIAVLVSNQSQTSNVISTAGGAFAQLIGKAVSPVSN
jgi:type III secretory pathway component EscU